MKTEIDKLGSFLKQITPLVEVYGRKSVLAEVDKEVAAIGSSTSVLFCGEFKRGKSSLINALVGDGLCPTDIGIATSVVTIIKYGTVKKAVRYYGNLLENSEFLKSEEIEWNDIEKYTMGDVLEIDNTVLVELSYPAPFLKDGITIIDTPGIGGLDPRHAILAYTALSKADVIVFVTDAGEPLTQSELNFYENKVIPSGKRNIVLVNKSDVLTASTLDVHMNNVKSQLSKLGEPKVLSVSAKYWDLYTRLCDEDLLLCANKNVVLESIVSEVELYRRGRYTKCRDVVVGLLDEVKQTISVEIEQLKKKSEEKRNIVENLQRQQLALSDFRTNLNNSTSPIRLRMNSIFEDARNEVQNLISHEGMVLVSSDFDSLLDSERGLDNDGKWLVSQINDRLQSLSHDVDKRIESAFEEISANIEKEIVNILDVETFLISDKLTNCNIVNSQLAFSLAGKMMAGGMIGGAVMVLTDLLISGIGIIAGLATVVALIWKQVSKEAQQQKRASLKQQILPKINLAITDMRNQANTRFSKFHQNLLQTLQTVISETESKMKVLQVSIQENRTSEHEGKEKIVELEQKAKFCATIISQMKLLYSNPFSNVK